MTHSLALQVARKNFLKLSYKKVTSFKLKPLTLRTSQFEMKWWNDLSNFREIISRTESIRNLAIIRLVNCQEF